MPADELTDEQVFGKTGEMSDAEVFGAPRRPDFAAADTARGNPFAMGPAEPYEPGDVPQAFLDRVRQGAALKRSIDRAMSSAGEGFGTEPLGLTDEHRRQLQDLRILPDPARGWPGPLMALQGGAIDATAGGLDAIMRMVSAGIHGAGGAFGQMVDEFTGSETQGVKAEREATNLGNMLLIESGMGSWARHSVSRDGVIHSQPVGGLPTDMDFRNAAEVIVAQRPKTPEIERVTGVVIQLDDGSIYVGTSHIDALAKAEKETGDINVADRVVSEEHTGFRGDFITSRGRLVGRKEAADIAMAAEQAKKSTPYGLFAEQLNEKIDIEAAERNLRELWQERGIHPAEAAHDAGQDAFLRDEIAKPGGALAEEPFAEGKRTIDYALGNVFAGRMRSASISVPEGGAGIHVEWDATARQLTIDNIDFERKGTGAFSAYLDHIEQLAADNGAASVKVESILNDRLAPFLERRGYRIEPATSAGGHPNAFKDIEPTPQPAGAAVTPPGAIRAEINRYFNDEIGTDDMSLEAAAIMEKMPKDIRQAGFNVISGGGRVDGFLTEHDILDEETIQGYRADVSQASREDSAKFEDWLSANLPKQPVGAAVTPPHLFPTPAQQPLPPPGSLVATIRSIGEKFSDIRRDIQMNVSPMTVGSPEAQALAKDFANTMRRNRWEWSRVDRWVVDDPGLKAARDRLGETAAEQRQRMWEAADEESVAIQLGESRAHQGLVRLEPEERAVVDDLQARAQLAWGQARSLGMVEGDGLPAYTPRMVLNVAEAGGDQRALPLNAIGRNLSTRTSQMLHREHMMAEETEAAAKERLRETMTRAGASQAEIDAAVAKVTIARDIRSLPLATAKLEDAIAGRILIDAIEDAGKRTGAPTVSFGSKPDKDWFTIDHPSFYRWQPKMKDGTVVKDEDGNAVFERAPIYVRGDFEGPLRSVLTKPSGATYQALMSLKGKTMGLIMNSPAIHNAVEWGRAMPAMPGKVATFRVYREGFRAKNDPAVMKDAIDAGLVPIGHRFFNQDISSIMEEPNLQPGRSWTAQVLGFVPGLFDPEAGAAVKAAIDKAGDFWHNTLLWDRVGDLQMGLYVNFRDGLLQKGVDRLTANRVAAHWANRYAGALPTEAMSDGARKISNLLLFSRSFTMGNLGAMKDLLTGLPKDVMAQIERDTGGINPDAAALTRGMARRKAMSILALDIGLMYIGNSILQSAINILSGDKTLDDEMSGYAARMHSALQETKEHPAGLLFPIPVLSEAMKFASHVSSTYENEPGKQDRVRIGQASDGTAIYLRNPIGKIGEEFAGYFNSPLDMFRRKLSTFARPAWAILANDKGFGHKIYDPAATLPADQLRNVYEIAKVLAKSEVPEGQMEGLYDLVRGKGDAGIAAAQAFLPFTGFTMSRGDRGGPAMGELDAARASHDYRVQLAMPDIRDMVQRGDIDGARAAMTELGIAPGLQRYYIRTAQDPRLRLSPKALQGFSRPGYATPEQRQRMEMRR